MVEDIHAEERASTDLDAAELGQYRAIQTTPLFSREGKPRVSSRFISGFHTRSNSDPACWICLRAKQADFIESLRATEQLRDADRRKDEFIATLSHELRNPLAAIDSSAMLLETPQLDSAKREWALQVVRRQCRTMKILLDDLLDVTRLTLGRVTLKKQTLTLRVTDRFEQSRRHNPSWTKPTTHYRLRNRRRR